MSKLNLFEENIFSQIAKLIALARLKVNLPKAAKLIKDDPDIQETLSSLRKNVDKLDQQMYRYCKDYPEKCKDGKRIK